MLASTLQKKRRERSLKQVFIIMRGLLSTLSVVQQDYDAACNISDEVGCTQGGSDASAPADTGTGGGGTDGTAGGNADTAELAGEESKPPAADNADPVPPAVPARTTAADESGKEKAADGPARVAGRE